MSNKPGESQQTSLLSTELDFNLSESELDVEYFEQFSWAVNNSFRDAVGYCRFEEGDMLYDTPKAYQPTWAESLKHVQFGIQVAFPPKANMAAKQKEAAAVFEGNWGYPAQVDFLYFEDQQFKEIVRNKTTEGRLYTFLWKGDPEILLQTEDPPIPESALSLKNSFKAVAHIFNIICTNYQFKELFVMPMDRSDSLLLGKYLVLMANLDKHEVKYKALYCRPEDVIKDDSLEFLPTLQLALFGIPKDENKVLEKIVKESFYKPTKGRITKEDRFNIDAHGFYTSGYARRQ